MREKKKYDMQFWIACLMIVLLELRQIYLIVVRKLCFFSSRRYSLMLLIGMLCIYLFWGIRLFGRELEYKNRFLRAFIFAILCNTMFLEKSVIVHQTVIFDNVYNMTLISMMFLPIVFSLLMDVLKNQKNENKLLYFSKYIFYACILIIFVIWIMKSLRYNLGQYSYMSIFVENIKPKPELVMMIGFIILGLFRNHKSIIGMMLISVIGLLLLIPLNVYGFVAYVIVSLKEKEKIYVKDWLGFVVFLLMYYALIKATGNALII